MNTIKRYGQHYRKYFEPSTLHNMKLSDIDTFILEKECNRIVKDLQLSGKEWTNAKTILNDKLLKKLEKRRHTIQRN